MNACLGRYPPAGRAGAEGKKIGDDRLSRVSFVMLIAVLFSTFALSIDKAISGIAPEYREAAQKRQAELLRQKFCTEKATNEKVVRRDLASFVLNCIDKIEKGERTIEK